MDEKNTIKHIGIIMDGNGRWAKEHKHARTYGHKKGYDTFREISDYAYECGVEVLSFYAFSTENWARPQAEVTKLLALLGKALIASLEELQKKEVRLVVSGDSSVLSSSMQKKLAEVCEKTKKYAPKTLNICFNYGARAEIVNAYNKMLSDGITIVDEKTLNGYLYTSELPDVDLIIRTGGEKRLSNFLLWQSAYAELYFTDVYWPDFSKEEFDKALEWFYGRKRRFGKAE